MGCGSVATTQLLLQINSKFGPGVLWNIVRGKYNTPREESRIFMFFDLNSSTTIAEKLGEDQFNLFLMIFLELITQMSALLRGLFMKVRQVSTG